MSLEVFRNKILAKFLPKDVIEYSVGRFENSEWPELISDVREWWKFFKQWEAQDTVAKAFEEQRLTVKGTSMMDIPIQADDPERGPKSTFDKPMQQMTGVLAAIAGVAKPEQYRIKKTNESIKDRLKPENFVPLKGGQSQKTELGLHDLSAGLMNPEQPISAQQYKSTPDPGQTYVFMPLSYAADQAVYQNINMLAKAYREQQGAFYTLVREIRSKMTRVKLAAEHDMASNFVLSGRTALGQPKFKLSLIDKTDVSLRDQEKGLVGQDVEFKVKGKDSKVVQVPTTLGILEARRHAALNFQSLVLGEMHSYGEVVIAYRQHAGGFPMFVQWDKVRSVWIVGTIGTSKVWTKKSPEVTIADKPA